MSTQLHRSNHAILSDSSAAAPRRVLANRANAQASTGPKTEEGKSRSSQNATITGLTGRTVLLASDDVDAYILHLSRHHAEYLPRTEAESELVQTIADSEWRLRRILVLEAGIYALGQRELADAFPEESREIRNLLTKAQTHLTYQRQLSNLSIQESRLQRTKLKAIAALEVLQKNRPQPPIAKPAAMPASISAAASASAIGFEFAHFCDTPSQPQDSTLPGLPVQRFPAQSTLI